MFLLVGLGAGLTALGLLCGAVWTYFKQKRILEGRVAATGTVVELTNRILTPGSAGIICPVVEFTAPSGGKIKFTSDFGSFPARYKIGQGVNVRYDPVDPQKAEIESVMNLWLATLILVFMGVVACCLATTFLGFYRLGAS